MGGESGLWASLPSTAGNGPVEVREDPGSSYIWLSGKVTSNLSQIPNNFCLFLPEILNSGQSVSHDFQKRKFHVINHPFRERSERTFISTCQYGSTWFYATLRGYFSPLTYCRVRSTTRYLDFESTLSSLANLWCCGQRQPVSLRHVCQNFCLSFAFYKCLRTNVIENLSHSNVRMEVCLAINT